MHVALRSVLVLLECTGLLAAWRPDKPSGRIYGGHEAAPHGYPYVVSLQQKIFFYRKHFCGGSLLTEQWSGVGVGVGVVQVVTAAHCAAGSALLEWLFPLVVVVGTHDVVRFDPSAQVSRVDKKIIHPHFDQNFLHNDIALIRATDAFELTLYVQTVRLPVDYQITARPLVLVGWGALRTTAFIPDTPRHLQEAVVKYMPYNECYEAVKKIQNEIRSNYSEEILDETVHICSAPEPSGVSGCPGDSGGPLVQYTRDDAADVDDTVRSVVEATLPPPTYPVLIGIASWIASTPCGRSGMPTIYTNVSHYIEFIEEFIDEKNGI